MPSDLGPGKSPPSEAQLDELELVLHQLDDNRQRLPSWVRVADARRIVELTLRQARGGASLDDQRELTDLRAGPSPVPWSWVPLDRDQPWQHWIDERVPATPTEKRHERMQRAGEAAIRGWIGHPAVAVEVKAAKTRLNELAEPLLLLDQIIVTLVAAHFLNGVAEYPDHSEWPDPFVGAPREPIELAKLIKPSFVAELLLVATKLDVAGARLDPTDPAVLLVLAQLALLEIDLSRPASELITQLHIWPPGWVDREAAALGHPASHASLHGRNTRFLADLAAFARTATNRLGPAAIPPPYGGGLKRQRPAAEHRKEARQVALRAVLADHPDTTAGRIRATWPAGPASPGGGLRNALGLQPHDPPPSEATLRSDLRELRR